MANIPKLSIITVNLNDAGGLQKTIQSVFAQTFLEYEYIIIDGGSKDGSLETIKKNEDKISHWVSEPDKGIYNAMNKGIKIAKGEYCLFLNSGDNLLANDTLKKIFSEAQDKDILYGNLQTPNGVFTYPDKITFALFFYETLGHQSAFIKRSLFERYGHYNEANKMVSDWEFFIVTLILNNCSYRHIDQVISVFNFEGLSYDEKNKALQMKEREAVLKKYFPMMYDDYIAMQPKLKELDFYKNSKLVQTVKKVQQSKFYKKIRGIK